MEVIRYEVATEFGGITSITEVLRLLAKASFSAQDALLSALKAAGMDVLEAEGVLGLYDQDVQADEQVSVAVVVGMALNAIPTFGMPCPTLEIGWAAPRSGLKYTTSGGTTFGWEIITNHPVDGGDSYRPFILARKGGTLEASILAQGVWHAKCQPAPMADADDGAPLEGGVGFTLASPIRWDED